MNKPNETKSWIHRENIAWPSPAQALRQLGILVLIVVVWSIILIGYLSVTGGQAPASSGSVSAPTQIATGPKPAAATALPSHTPDQSAAASSTPAPSGATASVSFAKDVAPIFAQRCAQCHGSRRASGGLSLASFADAMKGASGAPVIVPGNPSGSILVRTINSGQMPRGGPKLSQAEIDTITNWIAANAPNN